MPVLPDRGPIGDAPYAKDKSPYMASRTLGADHASACPKVLLPDSAIRLVGSYNIRNSGFISIRFQRSDSNSELRSRTDLGTSQSGKAMYLSVTDEKKGSGPGGADQQ
jgi:hypothetical protein